MFQMIEGLREIKEQAANGKLAENSDQSCFAMRLIHDSIQIVEGVFIKHKLINVQHF